MVGFTLAFHGAPTAQADEDSFVRSVQSLGFPQAPTNLKSIAQSACYYVKLNRDPDEVLGRIIRMTRAEPEQGRQFFRLAVDEFCPEFHGVAG
ncbi:DUF732 domain-containing protein [Mycobacterium sp. E1747]|uniref:DUF732 domain-containing protein n=1 Tax=Mycobacterium sp. E1747 TaxID=1834128 RepID=UPI000AC97860|nr:DUF732 domain-containing protein [Mycobacterium sp. E1747]